MNPDTSKPYIQDFCLKIKKLKETDVIELNLIIDQLNALHYCGFTEENKPYNDLLYSLVDLISPKNDHMLSKFCCLLYSLLHKRKIILQKSSLEYLVQFMISALRSCADWVRGDVLMALAPLLENNGDHINIFSDDLVGKNGILTNILLSDKNDRNLQYNIFQCLFSLIKNPNENVLNTEILTFCFQNCLLVLKDGFICDTNDLLTLKIAITSLKCLQQVFTSKSVKIENFGELLGTLKNLLFYGLPGQTFTLETNLYPTLRYPDNQQAQETQSESDSPYPKLRKQKKNKRRPKKLPQNKQMCETTSAKVESDRAINDATKSIANVSLSSSAKNFHATKMRVSSSDSELSDAESHTSKIKSLQASVRQNAYQVLQNVVKIADKKLMFGYWSYFLPEHPVIRGLVSSPNIFTTIMKDPASQVRLCALTLLAEILRGSKQFLMHADGRNAKHMSFTSLSSILATMIEETHRYLLLAFLSENTSPLLIQIMKCYEVLSANVPYCKLNNTILLKFLKNIKSYLHHKDIQIRVACISVFCSLINSDQIPVEIQDLMLSSDSDSAMKANDSLHNESSDSSDDYSLPWIIELCKDNILNEEPLPIQIQSLQLLCSVVGKCFQKSYFIHNYFFTIIEEIVLFCLNDQDISIQLHGAKLLDIVGRSVNIVTDVEFRKALNQRCQCYGGIGFEKLPPRSQIMYLTILLGLTSDSNPNVRGAAIRCLGLYCLFPSLIQDASFLEDVSSILIKSVDDSNVNVRFKASWSLGNLCDALFVNEDEILRNEAISLTFFYSIGMACVQFSKDCDRVKANAVRALGILLNYIPEDFMGFDMMSALIQESCEVLKSALSSNFMKVCWNSCYALGNMLRNTNLLLHCHLNLDVFDCLLNVLKSPNFKVRISAAQALTTLTSREQYGDHLIIIWQNLISTLLSTSSDVNFKEMKHQENLLDQLCYSLCHLASLLTLEDILKINSSIVNSQEVLLISMWKFGSRLCKEKDSVLHTAIDKINSLKKASNDSEQTLIVLLDILNQASIAFYNQDN
ncbi:hypothetical protein CDAR_124091 [Caerostris darwini]|uniref:HEAT repeat-containing protein 6 n=1 Tax=Caerostris darwini TaxID=1538125 RepID=A0AAV4TPP4_9ARAC|nr:hypothetical protein CDAR_124091 [Caerostris darwini]